MVFSDYTIKLEMHSASEEGSHAQHNPSELKEVHPLNIIGEST